MELHLATRTAILTVMLCACAAAASAQAPPVDRRAVITELHFWQTYFAGGRIYPHRHRDPETNDVTVLVGMTQREIRGALGAPHVCDRRPVAPCRRAGDWYYDFYFRSPSQVGGGRHLYLGFDRRGVCNSAEWRRTR